MSTLVISVYVGMVIYIELSVRMCISRKKELPCANG
jgi:hypothetical protein